MDTIKSSDNEQNVRSHGLQTSRKSIASTSSLPTGQTKSIVTSPRTIIVRKKDSGFGFNVRGQVCEGGSVKSIGGTLYGPLQHVSAVADKGSAEKAGLSVGDKILEVNGVDVEGFAHKQVVDLIKKSGDQLTLVVIASTSEELHTNIISGDDSSGSSNDYSERRSLAITIPDYSILETRDEKYCVFNIHIAGRHLCSRRYREFASLHNNLKNDFSDFNFPPLPKKWPFKLSEQQLDARRRGLEVYIEKICSVKVIGDSELVQNFLSVDVNERDTVAVDIEIKILLPDQTICTIKEKRFSMTDSIYQNLVQKIKLPSECVPLFYLFEIIDHNFERKLRSNEYPHQIYVQNCCTSNTTCLSLRKFVFSPSAEIVLLNYALTREFLYRQAIDEINRSNNDEVIEHRSTLKNLPQNDFIKFVQKMDDYNSITFPLCPCSSRQQNACVIMKINYQKLLLFPCDTDGKIEQNQLAEFQWNEIMNYYTVDHQQRTFDNKEKNIFLFEYKRSSMKTNKTVRLFTFYSLYMYDCFERIFNELNLVKPIIKNTDKELLHVGDDEHV
ncbi:unnamed protein product [Didymodactylos carnosus]|uniref:Sorting nexin-27 n=1 Tax=Didymodactylos carnosus TaxID=1234261 RepID=A0A8S2CXF4_9BILA|nr:unnamed protein product [Didymodactylos carnosus]CAF3540989.1 unnamed protein product [Didymodactylos carnosus]